MSDSDDPRPGAPDSVNVQPLRRICSTGPSKLHVPDDNVDPRLIERGTGEIELEESGDWPHRWRVLQLGLLDMVNGCAMVVLRNRDYLTHVSPLSNYSPYVNTPPL